MIRHYDAEMFAVRQFPFNFYSGPLVALGALVAVACLACSWYINRLQSDLSRAVRQEAVGMVAATDIQVQLRHLRVHSLVLVSDDTEERRRIVRGDLKSVDRALEALEQSVATSEDMHLLEVIKNDYEEYRNRLGLDQLPISLREVSDLARWSDAHHMEDLLAPCQELADRQRARMNSSLERSEDQTAWAGRVLLCLGLAGILSGLLSGYITARTLTRRVAQLSIRVQAVQAQLDQEVGAMTVQGSLQFEDLDEQLTRVVGRVSAVCSKLQEQERGLLRAEQLAAVGQLAAGVAHEVRNPLTGVKLLLQAAVREGDPTPLTAERLHLLLQEVARIERTIQGLMDFAASSPRDRVSQDIRSIILAAVPVAQSRADVKSVAVVPKTGNKPVLASVNSDQLLSLLTNLLFNAIDASPIGGEVEIATDTTADGRVRIQVTDNGSGIDRAIGDRLFMPFNTTKPTGTGLGLTIARRIAREHGGDLTATNRVGGGACFVLTLPTAEVSHVETAGH